jgi:Fe2+ or Zn2+ uptake regulation protein
VNGEERFDGRVSPHPHLICSHCGKVVDLSPEEGVSPGAGPSSQADGTGLPEGFVIDYRKTVYYGLCGKCAAP